MPATTALSPVPAPRPGLEAQVAAVPGYYLSDTVRDDAGDTPSNQVSGMIEPGELIGVPGLSFGARWVSGDDANGYGEPMVRYRIHLDDSERFALSGVAFGTHARGSSGEQSYSATRVGAEAMVDARLTPTSRWAELHLTLAAAATGLDAEGRYCLDADLRYGRDCEDSAGAPISASASGLYPTGTAMLALDAGRHLPKFFHGGRLALLGSAGSQPVVEGGEQKDARPFFSSGLSLTLGFGSAE
jgi:hypothetical protein